MANIMRDGFEGGDLLRYSNISTQVTAATDQKKTGAYALKFGNHNAILINYNLPSTYTELFFKGWFYTDNVGVANTGLFLFRTAAGVNVASLTRTALGQLELRANNVVKATTTYQLVVNTWYLLEMRAKIDGAAGELEVKVDGVSRATFSGDTNDGGTSIGQLNWSTSAFVGSQWWDDIGLNDTSGGADNTWVGDTRILGIKANGAGNYSQWAPSAGSNYQNVDEVPADGDTTYNAESVAGEKDSYNLEACGLTGVTIRRVWTEAVLKNTVADGSQARMFIRTNSTDYNDSVGSRTLTATYARYVSGEWATNPNTAAAWTTAEIDALEAGVEVI